MNMSRTGLQQICRHRVGRKRGRKRHSPLLQGEAACVLAHAARSGVGKSSVRASVKWQHARPAVHVHWAQILFLTLVRTILIVRWAERAALCTTNSRRSCGWRTELKGPAQRAFKMLDESEWTSAEVLLLAALLLR